MKKLLPLFLLASSAVMAQTFTDGLIMPKKNFCTGFLYSHDSWKNYWEGSLKRDNQNLGTVSTTSVLWMGAYGVTDKINIIAMAPYIKTKASSGTLHGMNGVQDLTVGVKYRLTKKEIGPGTLSTFANGYFSTPLTDYTPDFLPLSIGMATTNLSGRVTAYYLMTNGFYANASAGYSWRSNTTLDRPSYYTNGNIYFTNEVQMPNQFQYNFNIGYHRQNLDVELNYFQQNTLGGGDIRKQDMPFVSNRMNFSKAGAVIVYYLPKPKYLAVRVSGLYTLAGRNVGQSTNIAGGIFYTIQFTKTNN